MRYVILVVIGLVLALSVAVLLKPKQDDAALNNDADWVAVAKMDMQPGSFIVSATHVSFVHMDDKDIKPNYIQKKNVTATEMEGAVVRNLIRVGEPIEKQKIVTPKEGGFLSAVLYPGTRAISVGVDVVSATAGFIFPGDKVDLLLTHSIDNPEGKKSFAAETFVENIRVLAIDQQVNNPENKTLVPKTVTLEVTPKQAERVLVAQEMGKISLILRSSGSVTFNNVSEVRTETFTRDTEVSKVLGHPTDDNVEVTITRGKSSTEAKVSKDAQGSPTPSIVAPGAVQTPPQPNAPPINGYPTTPPSTPERVPGI